MNPELLWSGVLTAILGAVGFALKSYTNDLRHTKNLLNNTREQIAREYVTKAEVHADINRVLDRFDRLEEKLDRIMKGS